jgi:hypothetical protein
MALIFPSSPTVGQTYTSGSSATYTWNGSIWEITTPPTLLVAQTVTSSYAPKAPAVNNSFSGTENLTITATTTAPTQPTTAQANYEMWKWENGVMNYSLKHRHDSATGATTGTGDYLFSLPTGYTFNTTFHPLFTSNIGTAVAENVYVQIAIPGSVGYVRQLGSAVTRLCAVPYTNTTFRLFLQEAQGTGDPGTYKRAMGNGNYTFNNGNYAVNVSFVARVNKT